MQVPLLALALLCVGSGLLLLPGVREGFLSQAATSFLDDAQDVEVLGQVLSQTLRRTQ